MMEPRVEISSYMPSGIYVTISNIQGVVPKNMAKALGSSGYHTKDGFMLDFSGKTKEEVADSVARYLKRKKIDVRIIDNTHSYEYD